MAKLYKKTVLEFLNSLPETEINDPGLSGRHAPFNKSFLKKREPVADDLMFLRFDERANDWYIDVPEKKYSKMPIGSLASFIECLPKSGTIEKCYTKCEQDGETISEIDILFEFNPNTGEWYLLV